MSKDLSTKLAFIVGHYKSGSTWISHALALHPDIICMREMHIFRYLRESKDFNEAVYKLFNTSSWGGKGVKTFPKNYLARTTRPFRNLLHISAGTSTLPTSQVPNCSQDLGLYNYFRLKNILLKSSSKREFLENLFSFLIECTNPNGYLIEKTPTNIYEIDEIKTYFPEAKLISIHRDGRDVAVSDRYHIRRHGAERTVRESAEYWKNAMSAEKDASKNHEIFQTSYERMHEDPKSLLKDLLIFLGLDHSESIIEEMIYKSSFKFATKGKRDKGKANNKNFRRKGIVGDWNNELTDDELNTINEVAGELLTEFNYK